MPKCALPSSFCRLVLSRVTDCVWYLNAMVSTADSTGRGTPGSSSREALLVVRPEVRLCRITISKNVYSQFFSRIYVSFVIVCNNYTKNFNNLNNNCFSFLYFFYSLHASHRCASRIRSISRIRAWRPTLESDRAESTRYGSQVWRIVNRNQSVIDIISHLTLRELNWFMLLIFHYRISQGIVDCLVKTVRTDGPIGVYRGFTAAVPGGLGLR